MPISSNASVTSFHVFWLVITLILLALLSLTIIVSAISSAIALTVRDPLICLLSCSCHLLSGRAFTSFV